ncbi:DUF3325 domain-containing protein [Alloalcanivorax xenomutans]|jgi:hypothetical protein|uniref:DUF3325 domain-containing protein n=1 Tax=Alloalcanivorax xenomutans TaxID=1094342 RepID=UPI0007A74E0E|nr:DUF3325 domain-containing protein [Alloalcanivorax xenomutans]KYZ85441.1 hypothetical protein A3Q32_04230 [Alcanivorax sp. KX64203]MBA4723209.1 DUF3325 domain-containing protein [Alcanivorax sp.]SOB95444.1 uncharacterized protein DUF3325 [Alloalcanivorax xenomutans]|tara:strand:- start:1728 stop:2057 length:330 start_codon:yes stop_codon:yes gene_type:complete
MPENVLLLAALLLSVIGLGWFALALDVHWKQACGKQARGVASARGLRLFGGVALALSLILCLQVDHPTMAALVWIMSLAGAALIVAFALSWRPHWLALLAARPPRRQAG